MRRNESPAERTKGMGIQGTSCQSVIGGSCVRANGGMFAGAERAACGKEYASDRDGCSSESILAWMGTAKRPDGRFVLERRKKNLIDFLAAPPALGDCEFEAVFSCNLAEYGARGGGRGPRILWADRGQFGLGARGTALTANEYKGSLPLADFAGPSPVNLGDEKLHRPSVKRVGEMLRFYVDGQPMLTQQMDPQTN